jgi:DNA-binding NarL/FixJ family response regulator
MRSRQDLVSRLGQSCTIDIVAVIEPGARALKAINTVLPDVVVVCVDGCVPGCLEAARQLLVYCPDVKVLVHAPDDDLELPAWARRVGLHGYVPESVGTAELVDAIRLAHQGRVLLVPAVAGRSAPIAADSPQVTDRERLMLQLLAQGQTDREVARHVELAMQTVKNALSALYRKLGVVNRAEAVALAARKGWLSEP